jgi:lipopolysaccharide biosynthesis glycosyltransferase
MEIVYSCDDRFAWIMGVSMLSLMENNREIDSIRFHILDGGISDESKQKINLMLNSYGRDCTFYPIYDIVESTITNQKLSRGSYSMFSRIFIGKIFPEHLTRVLYLDCDTLVLGTLDELWGIDIEDNIVAAVNDCFSVMHRKLIGLQKTDVYFNSGVLLINMLQWRKFDVEEKICHVLAQSSNLPYPDQCALNMVLATRTKLVHPKYNCLPYPFKLSYPLLLKLRKPSFYYSEAVFNEAAVSPVIVHFATFFLFPRPWISGTSRNKYHEKWRYYWSISRWRSHCLWPDNRKFLYKVLMSVFHLLPQLVSVSIAGFLHAWLIPLIGILNRRKNVG